VQGLTQPNLADSVHLMAKLTMHDRLVHTTMVSDLENFIEEVYGHSVEIQAMEEAGNDDTLSFFATNTLISAHDEQAFNEWKATGEFIPFGTAMLLNFLVRDHHIPSGYYGIVMGY
jgi:hypothetical protein